MQQLYNCAENITSQYYKITFLETCYHYKITPKGLRLLKQAQSIRKDDLQKQWDGILTETERILLKTTIENEIKTMRVEEAVFWEGVEMLQNLERESNEKYLTTDWLVKLRNHCKKLE